MSRVAVFVDYQNMYHGARRAFGDPVADPPSFGHFDPAALALHQAAAPGRAWRRLGVSVTAAGTWDRRWSTGLHMFGRGWPR